VGGKWRRIFAHSDWDEKAGRHQARTIILGFANYYIGDFVDGITELNLLETPSTDGKNYYFDR